MYAPRQALDQQLAHLRQEPDGADQIQRLLQPYRNRLFDISIFVKELKGRFAQWYNRRHGRYGVLWAERSVKILRCRFFTRSAFSVSSACLVVFCRARSQFHSCLLSLSLLSDLSLFSGFVPLCSGVARSMGKEDGDLMEQSIRNEIPGTVKEIISDKVLSEVIVETAVGDVAAIITTRSVHDMGLKVGDRVAALVKATNVSVHRQD